MASKTIAIHPAESSVLAGTKSAVICTICRKHDAVQTHESIEKYQSTTKDAGHFDCSICLNGCHDPVVTLCGHLFCWPCLYYWLSLHSLSQKCPVCNANLLDKIIPLYGHGDAEPSMTSPAVMFPDLHVPSRPSPSEFSATVIATTTVTNRDGDLRNNAIQANEIHSTSRLTASSANVGFFASMLIRSCVASFTPHRHRFFCGRRPSNRASILQGRRQQQRRFNNEKELVLHWVFIFVASIAIACFIVY